MLILWRGPGVVPKLVPRNFHSWERGCPSPLIFFHQNRGSTGTDYFVSRALKKRSPTAPPPPPHLAAEAVTALTWWRFRSTHRILLKIYFFLRISPPVCVFTVCGCESTHKHWFPLFLFIVILTLPTTLKNKAHRVLHEKQQIKFPVPTQPHLANETSRQERTRARRAIWRKKSFSIVISIFTMLTRKTGNLSAWNENGDS